MKNTRLTARLLILPFLLSMGSSSVLAQENSTSSDANGQSPTAPTDQSGAEDNVDLAAIRQSAAAFVDAFNQENADELAGLWTESGDYIDENGQVFAGREAIAKEYTKFFEAHDGVKLRLMIDSLRLLSADAAIEDGRALLDPLPAGAPAISKYTTVHVKVDGKWQMSTVRDVRIETPSAYHNLEDLEWLIGAWTAEEHGVQINVDCRWIANKSFVERRYTVTHPDHSTQSGVEIIGFNPQGGHLQSWNFHSGGGYAIGVWSPRANGWQAEVHGVTGEGASTLAVNLLTRLDETVYAWQSVQRSAGGTALPDTDQVILKRVPAK